MTSSAGKWRDCIYLARPHYKAFEIILPPWRLWRRNQWWDQRLCNDKDSGHCLTLVQKQLYVGSVLRTFHIESRRSGEVCSPFSRVIGRWWEIELIWRRSSKFLIEQWFRGRVMLRSIVRQSFVVNDAKRVMTKAAMRQRYPGLFPQISIRKQTRQ